MAGPCLFLFLLVRCAILCHILLLSSLTVVDTACVCHPELRGFNETIEDTVTTVCRKCYYFQYDYIENQEWAARICVGSPASRFNPLTVIVQQAYSVKSFQVPLTFVDDSSEHNEVCHTLCPIANYHNTDLKNNSRQNITLNIWSSQQVEFQLRVVQLYDFVIGTDESMTFNLTPSQPRVLQFNMPTSLSFVRVEATSLEKSCMILAIQDIECPFYDMEKTMEQNGYFQTLTRKSGISVSRESFKNGFYVVLILKPNDEDCFSEWPIIPSNGNQSAIINNQSVVTDNQFEPGNMRQKEVTLRIVPSITDAEFNKAVYGVFGFYISFYLLCAIIRFCCGGKDGKDDDDGAKGDSKRQEEGNYEVVFLSELAKKKGNQSGESKAYSWNVLTIGIFYGLPAVQLVFLNLRILNTTGNQDLCHYNFLCSHHVWLLNDFNHFYSNIGYVMLGILFLLIVLRREQKDNDRESRRQTVPDEQLCGIPRHYGMYYAMGWALIMEGLLSATYHVCPNETNFQFDTAFMFVICTICMMKLYHGRHPDISAQSHTTWLAVAVVVMFGVVGVLFGGRLFWAVLGVTHTMAIVPISVTLYYKERLRLGWQCCWSPMRLLSGMCGMPRHPYRFSLLLLTIAFNIGIDIFGLVNNLRDVGLVLLILFIGNLVLYFMYYCVMKLHYEENICGRAVFFIILSAILWGFALSYFAVESTSNELTPAESREKNIYCLVGTSNFYSYHDIWHFLSSFALFFTFLTLSSIDRDLEHIPRTRIHLF